MPHPQRGLALVRADTEQFALEDIGYVLAIGTPDPQPRLAYAENEIAVIAIGAALGGNGGHPQGVLPVRVHPLEIVYRVRHDEAVNIGRELVCWFRRRFGRTRCRRHRAIVLRRGGLFGAKVLGRGRQLRGGRLPGFQPLEFGVHRLDHPLLLPHGGFLLVQLRFQCGDPFRLGSCTGIQRMGSA